MELMNINNIEIAVFYTRKEWEILLLTLTLYLGEEDVGVKNLEEEDREPTLGEVKY